jgi:hypothetical protein
MNFHEYSPISLRTKSCLPSRCGAPGRAIGIEPTADIALSLANRLSQPACRHNADLVMIPCYDTLFHQILSRFKHKAGVTNSS